MIMMPVCVSITDIHISRRSPFLQFWCVHRTEFLACASSAKCRQLSWFQNETFHQLLMTAICNVYTAPALNLHAAAAAVVSC
jgi:hypothetical protein